MSLKNNIGFFEEKEGVKSWLRLASSFLLAYIILSNLLIVASIIWFNASYPIIFYIYHIIDNVTFLGYVFIPKVIQKKYENGNLNS